MNSFDEQVLINESKAVTKDWSDGSLVARLGIALRACVASLAIADTEYAKLEKELNNKKSN